MPMEVRAKAMVSERNRMVITAMAAMDIMAPRLVACVFVFYIFRVLEYCAVLFFSKGVEASKVVWSI